MSRVYKNQIKQIKCPICGQTLNITYVESDTKFDGVHYYCDDCDIELVIYCYAEEDNNMNDRINAITAFAQRRDIEIANKKKQAEDREEFLKQTILGWSDRIQQLIDTANACVKNGIKFYHNGTSGCNYDGNHFITDAWCHILGFEFNKCHPTTITRIGKMGGGACDFDIYTDGKTITATGGSRLWALEQFVDSFDEFESKFYAYVDKICKSK